MGINITLNSGETTAQEWRALVAFASIMTGDELIAPNAEKIVRNAEGWTAEFDKHGFVVEAPSSPTPLPPIAPVDNPATGTDPELAGFGMGNAPGGTVTAVSLVADPAAGIAPSLPPAMPPAPPAPVTVAAAPASNVLLDVRGLPWDHRIHSGEKTQNKDGSWRNKRGLADGLVETVEAELRAVMAIPAQPLAGLPPPPTGALLPPPPPTDTGPITFLKLMPKVTGAIKSGQTTQEHVNAVLKQFGFPHLPAVNTRPDLLQAVHDGIFGGGA